MQYIFFRWVETTNQLFSLISLGQNTVPPVFPFSRVGWDKGSFSPSTLRDCAMCSWAAQLVLHAQVVINGTVEIISWLVLYVILPNRKVALWTTVTLRVYVSFREVSMRSEWNDAYTVDGSEILRSPVEGKVVEIPLCTRFYYIPGGAGFCPSTVSWLVTMTYANCIQGFNHTYPLRNFNLTWPLKRSYLSQ